MANGIMLRYSLVVAFSRPVSSQSQSWIRDRGHSHGNGHSRSLLQPQPRNTRSLLHGRARGYGSQAAPQEGARHPIGALSSYELFAISKLPRY